MASSEPAAFAAPEHKKVFDIKILSQQTSRTRPSPKRAAKKLFADEDTMDDDGDGAAVAAEPRYLLAFVYGSVFMFSRYALFFNCCCS